MTRRAPRAHTGLLGHGEAEIVASLGDPEPEGGLLPKWNYRVRVDGRFFVFTLTRQSDFDGGDPRDRDGFERCWFVWSVQPDNGGNVRAESQAPIPEPV